MAYDETYYPKSDEGEVAQLKALQSKYGSVDGLGDTLFDDTEDYEYRMAMQDLGIGLPE